MRVSHWTKVQTQIKDLDALARAAESLGYRLQTGNVEVRGFYQPMRDVDAAIRLRGPYDVGFKRQQDGTYAIVCDFWAGHVEQELGPKCGRLLQEYAYQVLRKQAQSRGLLISRQTRQDGSVVVVLKGGRL